MTRPTFTISVPGYVPVTVTLEPAAVIDGPAVPPTPTDAPQPIVGALADLERRRAMAAARQQRRRDRLASRSPSVTERDEQRDERDESVTSSVTEEGGLGGDGSEAFSVERLENKAETQETPDPKPSQSAPIAPVSRHARVTLSRSPVTLVTHPEEPMPTIPDIIAAWPQSAGRAPSKRDIGLAVRGLILQGHTEEAASRFLYRRVQAYAAGKYVETTEPKYRPGFTRWLSEDALDAKMPPQWFQANPASEFKGKAASVATGKTAAQSGVKTL